MEVIWRSARVRYGESENLLRRLCISRFCFPIVRKDAPLDWFQTVSLLIVFSAVLCIVLSLVYHLVAYDSRHGDALLVDFQDLTHIPRKEALVEMFLMPESIPSGRRIEKAFVFADEEENGDVSLGYAVEYSKRKGSILTRQVSYVMERVPGGDDEHGQHPAVARKVSDMDELLGKLSARCGFDKSSPLMFAG